MYRTFSIQNFRGIAALHVDDLGQINLISGPNDVGKTAALEAIFLHACGPLAGQFAIQTVRVARSQASLELASDETPWNSLFRGFDASGVITLEGSVGASRYQLVLSQPQADQAVDVASGDSAQQVWSSSLQIEEKRDSRPAQTYRSTLTVQSASLPGVGGQQTVVQMKIEPHASRPFQPARLLATNRAALVDLGAGYSRLRQQSRADDLLDALKVVDSRIQSLELLLSDGRPTLHAVLDGGGLVPFPLMGDGISSVAALIIGMIDIRDGVLLVDEIENGLHYSVLRQLWHHVHKVARRLNVQVFATTHSYECVVAAHEALAGEAKALRLIRFSPGHEPADSPNVVVYDTETLAAGIELDAALR
jgi:hypothetical protein